MDQDLTFIYWGLLLWPQLGWTDCHTKWHFVVGALLVLSPNPDTHMSLGSWGLCGTFESSFLNYSISFHHHRNMSRGYSWLLISWHHVIWLLPPLIHCKIGLILLFLQIWIKICFFMMSAPSYYQWDSLTEKYLTLISIQGWPSWHSSQASCATCTQLSLCHASNMTLWQLASPIVITQISRYVSHMRLSIFTGGNF